MYGEARKLHLIEALLKEENSAVLEEVEKVLSRSSLKALPPRRFADFGTMMTKEEANEPGRIIEDGCKT